MKKLLLKMLYKLERKFHEKFLEKCPSIWVVEFDGDPEDILQAVEEMVGLPRQ